MTTDGLRFGIHLPQFGRAAVAGAIERAAQHAEALGYDDVWVSDHLVIPEGQSYPAPHLCDPLMSLAFAAAVTEPSVSARACSSARSTRARSRSRTRWRASTS